MSLKLILTSFLALTAIASPVPAPAPAPDTFAIPQPEITERQLGSSTKNEVINGVCRPVTYIFARGTGESGNLGSSVGPALETALESLLGGNSGVATQGVTYPASVAGAVSGSVSPQRAEGAIEMARLTRLALSNCPDTQVVLAGYSQGAQQVHGALLNLQRGQVSVSYLVHPRYCFTKLMR